MVVCYFGHIIHIERERSSWKWRPLMATHMGCPHPINGTVSTLLPLLVGAAAAAVVVVRVRGTDIQGH